MIPAGWLHAYGPRLLDPAREALSLQMFDVRKNVAAVVHFTKDAVRSVFRPARGKPSRIALAEEERLDRIRNPQRYGKGIDW